MRAVKTHDYAAQRRETVETFRDMPKETVLPAVSDVDFLFFAEETDADWAGLERVLTELVYRCIAIQTFFPAGVIKNSGCYFISVDSIYKDGANGISTVINSNNILIIHIWQAIFTQMYYYLLE